MCVLDNCDTMLMAQSSFLFFDCIVLGMVHQCTTAWRIAPGHFQPDSSTAAESSSRYISSMCRLKEKLLRTLNSDWRPDLRLCFLLGVLLLDRRWWSFLLDNIESLLPGGLLSKGLGIQLRGNHKHSSISYCRNSGSRDIWISCQDSAPKVAYIANHSNGRC